MPQKIFEPFKRLPHQLQNLNLIQKLQGLSLGRSAESFGSYLAGTFGCLESPSAIAFDEKLGLLVVGSKKGVIRVYGTPGVVLTVRSEGSGVLQLLFLPEEGRFVATFVDGSISLFELDPRNGGWSERSHLHITNPTNEHITSLALGHGVLYVGSSTGVLYQVAVKNGRLCLGDPTLTSLTSAMVLESVPIDKREGLGVDSPIVTLQYQPEGSLLLVAYSGGCVAVVIPQSVSETNGTEKPSQDAAAPTAQENTDTPATAESAQAQPDAKATDAEGDVDTSVQPAPETPVKSQSEKRTTLKLKEFTRSLRRFELGKHETEDEPPLPVPPSPRVSHVLLRDQPVEWATWRISTPGVASNEVTVAYGDGAFQVWPISAPVMKDNIPELVMVSKRDPPSTPYGPLPCGAINKIVQSPGLNGVIFTVFSGGLPRAEFDDRHAVSVLQDPEHHVCFQFGSKVIDFILLSQKPDHSVNDVDATTEEHITRPSSTSNASALLVLTERELVAIDLQHPNWPTFSSPYLNCLDLSPVTAVAHVTKVSSTLFSRLRDNACNDSTESTHAQWPIWGGANGTADVVADLSHNDCNDVLVLGHANGWITLLGIGRGDALHRLGTLRTELLFNLADGATGTVDLETWPPFRRVGDCALAEPFCPQAPDSRLALTQLVAYTTADSMTIVAGGAAGQVSVWSIDEHGPVVKPCFEPDISRVLVHLIEEDPANPRYVWDGPAALKPFEGAARGCGGMGAGFSPCALIQLYPPAPVTALALELSWNLLAVGCPFGMAVVDTLANSAIHTDLTLPSPAEQTVRKLSRGMNVASVQTAISNRGKQITAQLRQSFRRLKHLRTSTSTAAEEPASPSVDVAASGEAAKEEPVEAQPDQAQPTTEDVKPAAAEPTEQVPVEQQPQQPETPAPSAAEPVEHTEEVAAAAVPTPPEPIHLTVEEPTSYTVRSLLFADTFVISPIPATAQQPAVPSPRTPCLWVGTANGRALAYGLKWDGTSGPVTVQLHKELQLQHRAPVIGLCVVDAHSKSPISNSSRTRTGYLSEIQPVEPATPASDETTDQANTSKDAAPPATPPAESHQLLLCSEEQVKIFQLPTLRALHKFKFVDRIRLPGHHGQSTTGSTTVSAETAVTKPEAADKEDAESKPCAAQAEVESKTAHSTAPQPNRKAVRAFGVQAFVRPVAGTPDQTKTEWNAVVTRNDGRIVILSLPHLRKLFKVKPVTEVVPAHYVPCVASLVDTNYVFWQSGCQLHAYELSPIPHLTSPASVVPGASTPLATITLPVWARPQQPTSESKGAAEGDVAVAASNGACADTAEVPLIDDTEASGVVVNGAAEVQLGREIETTHPLKETYSPAAALHAGDVTIDSIKEYLNGEGTVTIKTIETSTEKRTLVEGGHVVTTVHEMERVDGQITKDDMLKFSTEDPVAPHAAVESS